jgi:protein-L-isoaspartate(D-aspartate) O-methyltransferase
VEFGRANLAGKGVPWARIEPARPGALGLPDEGPFDRILVSAEAPAVPDALVGQLRVDGLMVIPVRGRLWAVHRPTGWPEEPVAVERHGHYSFVPLHEPDGAARQE